MGRLATAIELTQPLPRCRAGGADEAGLVDVVDGKTVLEDGYTIQPCSTEEDTGKPIAVPPAVT